MNIQLSAAALLLALLTGCSDPSDVSASHQSEADAASAPTSDPADERASPGEIAGSSAPTPVLELTGIGPLVIGESVPAGSGFDGASAAPGSTCRLFTSADMPGVIALTENGVIRRITITEKSKVALEEGVAVGSTREEVLKAFPGFVQTAHKYEAAPAGYLTQPGKDPRLSFEIGGDDRVQAIHVGLMPQLAYVEGCG